MRNRDVDAKIKARISYAIDIISGDYKDFSYFFRHVKKFFIPEYDMDDIFGD